MEKTTEELTFKNWQARESYFLLALSSCLILAIHPGFHFVLSFIPDLPADSLTLRLIAATIAGLCLGAAFFVEKLRYYSSELIIFVWGALLVTTTALVINSENNYLYVSAGLLPIFGSQLGFAQFRYLLVTYGVAVVFHITYAFFESRLQSTPDFVTLTIYVNAYVISGFFGWLRIKGQDNAFWARKKINDTLTKVSELKNQQDADYFLTSLLIKPLGVNTAKNGNVNVESYVKQKKSFSFRKWDTAIGGDLNIAHKIKLQERTYTVFLNSDAMGKSMQGAGGALVLGAVFNSILERTRLTSNLKGTYPERWLKNCFVELHKVFSTFDGSMLISLVMGLVDDTNGLVYYLNAEHPRTILLRNHKARFLDATRYYYRKLGTQGVQGSIQISLFQMEAGDKLILGSDGRDDIILPSENEEEERINEDENLILQVVEQANGNLGKIHNILLENGELKDDLSLLGVSYQGQLENVEKGIRPEQPFEIPEEVSRLEEEVHKSSSNPVGNEVGPNTIRKEIRHLVRERDYDAVAKLCSRLLDEYPASTEYLFIGSFAYKKIKEYETSIDFGERYRLREPTTIKNLINLIDVYLRRGDYLRADTLLDQARQIDNENPQVLKLQSILKERTLQANAALN